MRSYLTFTLIAASLAAHAQPPYGNEWIDWSNPNPYLKVYVVSEGVYRIDRDSLAAALVGTGKTINDVNPLQLQVFHMGEEQYIYVHNPANLSSLDPGEYFEFYANRNEGKLDESLYPSAEDQANPYYSLFSDSAAYFITWNPFATSPKRLTTLANDLTNLPPKETWYMHRARHVWNSTYWQGVTQAVSVYYLNDSRYDNAEGYGGPVATPGVPQTYGVSLSNMALSAPVSVASFKARSVSRYPYPQWHYLRITVNGTETVNTSFQGEQTRIWNFTMPLNSLINGSNNVVVTSLGGGLDHNGISGVDVLYPHTWDFGQNAQQWFGLEGVPGTNKYIEISNFFHQNQTVIIYDMTNHQRMVIAPDAGLIKAKIPMGSADSLALFISSQSTGVIRKPRPRRVQFTNFNLSANQGNYFIVTHPKLTETHLGSNWVEKYRQLRSERYDSRVVMVQQLYDQFAYGVPVHPMGFRNFIRYASETFPDSLEHVFIIGKGYTPLNIRTNATLYAQSLIPTYGYTPGDNLLACQGYDLYPLCGIGRLAATSPEHVRIYYEKMKAQEDEQKKGYTIENKDWMKRILHLGGGTSYGEQNLFKAYLGSYQTIVEDTFFGGNVISFYKTSPDPVQIPNYFQNLIDEGVALITFFGHSSPGILEFSLNDPGGYNNTGRFPVIYANGCLSGTICSTSPGISEEYVLEDSKGAIAFIATSGFGISSTLNTLSRQFYQNLAATHYGEDLGHIMMQAYRSLSVFANPPLQMLIGQQTLHGDPACRFGTHPKPDYAIEESSLSFSPEVVTTDINFFDLKVDVHNIGRAVNGTFNVKVDRKLANGTSDFVVKQMYAPRYLDTVVFTFPVDVITSVGWNEFTVTVDIDPDAIDEIDNIVNNRAETKIFISSSDAFPIFPYNYSIVTNPQVKLAASTIDPFVPVNTYHIQIDTSKLFNSSMKRETQVTQGGGVVAWNNPTIPFVDGTVYYWRIAPFGTDKWHTSSFLYKPGGEPGWNQSHYYQFNENGYHHLEIEPSRKFEFVSDFVDIEVNIGYYPNAIGDVQDIGFYIDGQIHHKYGCVPGLILAVFDPLTGLPWKSNNPQYNWINNACTDLTSGNRQHAFNLRTNSFTNRQHVVDVLNTIPDSHYILLMSLQAPGYTDWHADSLSGTSLFDLLNSMGAIGLDALDTLSPQVQFVFFTKKGDISKSQTHLGQDINSIVNQHFFIDGLWDRGYMYSAEIGPAYEWNDLQFNWYSVDSFPSDFLKMDVYGKSHSGDQEIIMTDITANTSLSGIDPNEYPYLHIEMYSEDTLFRTAPQLNYWRVLHQPSPDAAVNPQIEFLFKADTLDQGDRVEFKVGIQNVTEYHMDSLLVQYVLYNQIKNVSDTIATVRYDSLRAGQHLVTQHSFNTLPYPGFNILTMEANPGHDQPEHHLFNNVAMKAFYVAVDGENPLLDITFDGYHIMDGDIVSAKPEILIRLKDENKFLAMNDSSLMEVYLKDPNGSKKRMDPDGQTVIFIPPDPNNLGKNNTAEVHMYPEFLVDGDYQLIVSGQDKTGNESADLDYIVNFKVINKPMISNVLNYPNPFTSSTRFVFTLTGSQIPDFMKIQIMTVSGKVVREITGPELGNLHVGVNISDYAWDGRDEFGDPLANGVYLYRVVAYLNGSYLDTFADGKLGAMDKYFTNGFGKMYLVR